MAVSSACSFSGFATNSFFSRARSARSVSACELTETYSPAAIDIAPATRPATPAVSTSPRDAAAAATPSTRLAVETIPSFAPSTAARSQPTRELRWLSRCLATPARNRVTPRASSSDSGQPVALRGEHEVALRESVDRVRPDRDADAAPGEEDVRVVVLRFRELADAVHERQRLR